MDIEKYQMEPEKNMQRLPELTMPELMNWWTLVNKMYPDQKQTIT